MRLVLRFRLHERDADRLYKGRCQFTDRDADRAAFSLVPRIGDMAKAVAAARGTDYLDLRGALAGARGVRRRHRPECPPPGECGHRPRQGEAPAMVTARRRQPTEGPPLAALVLGVREEVVGRARAAGGHEGEESR